MKDTGGDIGTLVIGLAFSLAMLALFALMAWKYWHGQWLRSIAGNNFVPEEEYGSPEQRKLGRRTSVAMVIACVMVASIPIIGYGSFLQSEAVFAAGSALCGTSTVALLGYLVWMFAVMGKERRAAENELVARDPSKSEDVKLDRRATVVLLVILAVYLTCVLVVAPLAARN